MKKWFFRLLVLCAVLIGLALFGLKILSGTSDTHKRGLEQAFSEIFKGEASFGELKAFNLFPQFNVEIEKLQVLGIHNEGNLIADKFVVTFGSIDLATKNRVIENFQIQNLSLTEGLYTPAALHLDNIGTNPTDQQDDGKLSFKGTYGTEALEGEFSMGMKSGARPKYFFNTDNPFTINIGAVQLRGIFSPYKADGNTMSAITLTAKQKTKDVECHIKEGTAISFTALVNDVIDKAARIKTPQDLNKICSSYK